MNSNDSAVNKSVVDAEKILDELKKGIVHPLYVLHGEEPFYIDQISDYVEEHVLEEGERAFNQVVMYGKETDFRAVVDEARQYPMISRYRVVILKEAQDMKTLQDLSTYLENVSPTTILVICYKYKKLDKRLRFTKLAEEKGVVMESKKLYDNQVAGWVSGRIKAMGMSADAGVSELLAEYLGADLSRINNELAKIKLNTGSSSRIRQDDVREQIGISKDFDVFEFQKTLGERNFTKSYLILRYFAANPSANPLVVLIASVFSYFQKMTIVKYHQSGNDQDLAKLAGISPFFVKEYRSAAGRYSFGHLRQIFFALKEADMSSKGVGSRHQDDESILKDILIACMYELPPEVKA